MPLESLLSEIICAGKVSPQFSWKKRDKVGQEHPALQSLQAEHSAHTAWPWGALQQWGREMQVFLEALELLAGNSKAGTFGDLHITDINKQGTEKTQCTIQREKHSSGVQNPQQAWKDRMCFEIISIS